MPTKIEFKSNADRLSRLNISLIHLVRRDYIRAEISHYLLNHKEAKCLPQDAMKTLFAKALQRHGEVTLQIF